jgi:hypothetical protein
MPDVQNVRFPADFCRVALFRSTLGDALRLSGDDTGAWCKDPSVVQEWTWTFYRQSPPHGKRGTLVGDVAVEENGDAWRVESNAISYLGNYPDAVATKGQ